MKLKAVTVSYQTVKISCCRIHAALCMCHVMRVLFFHVFYGNKDVPMLSPVDTVFVVVHDRVFEPQSKCLKYESDDEQKNTESKVLM